MSDHYRQRQRESALAMWFMLLLNILAFIGGMCLLEKAVIWVRGLAI